MLANNDLWIEVTVDGESVPAIAAPARFLFPAFGGTELKDFNTLVMSAHDGYANLLAMPFGRGISVAAHNRGSKPIEKVALSMSIDRATDKNRNDYAGRMRLRGVFQPAGSAPGVLVEQLGGGRWVSLVVNEPEAGACGISSLVADSVAHDGWAMSNLDAFWGRPGEGQNFYGALSGRRGGLAWRYLLLSPVEFDHSLIVKTNAGDKLGDRLASST